MIHKWYTVTIISSILFGSGSLYYTMIDSLVLTQQNMCNHFCSQGFIQREDNPSRQKCENYDVIITSKATIRYTTQ